MIKFDGVSRMVLASGVSENEYVGQKNPPVERVDENRKGMSLTCGFIGV